jgi:23S rRNA (adenine2503-C2)-methyltransferase
LASEADVSLTTARRTLAAMHQRGLDDLATQGLPLPRVERERLAARYRTARLRVVERVESRVDPFLKYLFEGEDGARFEAVRIPLEREGRFSVCVSSQVGCALACEFCATGKLGLTRNLASWEIVEQVRAIRLELPRGTRIHGVVFQGMGEPLANVERVIEAVEVLSHPCGQSVDQRSITVSTAGLPSGIRRLARAGLRVRLGVSIGSGQLDVRRRLMPIEGHHTLAEVLEAAAEHTAVTGYAPMLAVTLLRGVNTSRGDAEALREQALAFRERTGVAPRISLIPYNPTGPGDPFQRAGVEEMDAFRAALAAPGLSVVRRYSGGGDVAAACGQLVANHERIRNAQL